MQYLNGILNRLGGYQRRTIIVSIITLLVTGSGFALTSWSVNQLKTTHIMDTSMTVEIQPDDSQARAPGHVDLFTSLKQEVSDTNRTHILTQYDRQLYRKIFKAQREANWSQANALLKRIKNPVLKGHVLFDRYIQSKDYKSSYHELRHWMVNYGDHPEAYKVYQLAQKRRNNDPASLPAPQLARKLFGSLEYSWLTAETSQKPKGHTPRHRIESDVRALMAQIKHKITKQEITSAYNLLGESRTSRMLSNVEYDSLLSEIAAGYYYAGKFNTALRVANQAIHRSDAFVPIAHWIAGLSSWQMNKFDKAAYHFGRVGEARSRNPWMLSAAAFWAARAHERLGNDETQNDWLQEAASYPRTFYGLLAQHSLGKDVAFSWDVPDFTDSLKEVLAKEPSGMRALALMDIEERELAEKEFRQIHPNGNRRMEKALIAVAHEFKLANLALRLGNAVNKPNGQLYDTALYPVIPWKGDATTGIDPALINALVRQESKFDPNAQNGRSGAKGLMQLMPRTARFISNKTFDNSQLHDPEINITLGQRYVRYLLNLSHVDNNLIYMAAAYNAGPGNLEKWQKSVSYKNDPLLFIESIPLSETRAFIERVMTNYWIYSQRFAQEASTLQELTRGQWPTYAAIDSDITLASY